MKRKASSVRFCSNIICFPSYVVLMAMQLNNFAPYHEFVFVTNHLHASFKTLSEIAFIETENSLKGTLAFQ